jgi:hypothetical protein
MQLASVDATIVYIAKAGQKPLRQMTVNASGKVVAGSCARNTESLCLEDVYVCVHAPLQPVGLWF